MRTSSNWCLGIYPIYNTRRLSFATEDATSPNRRNVWFCKKNNVNTDLMWHSSKGRELSEYEHNPEVSILTQHKMATILKPCQLWVKCRFTLRVFQVKVNLVHHERTYKSILLPATQFVWMSRNAYFNCWSLSSQNQNQSNVSNNRCS